MATTIRPTPEKLEGTNMETGQHFAETNTVSTVTTSNVIIIPKLGGKAMISNILLHLILTATITAKVQFTIDSIEEIENDTAEWGDWDVNGIGEDPLVAASVGVEFTRAVTGFRVAVATVSGGTAKLKARFNLQA